MSIKPHKRNDKYYNHSEEKARHRLLNVAQVAWHVLVRKLQAKRPVFVDKNTDLRPWSVKPSFEHSHNTSVTWLGHASCLINIGGLTFFTDPVLGDLGRLFKRMIPAPMNAEELPHIDVVLLSHNHKDHLDLPTLERLKRFNPLVFVPEGDGKLLRSIGFHRVQECTWHETVSLEKNLESLKVELIFLPAIHWSGRGVLDVNKALWGSWLIRTNEISVYFAGDTAYGEHFTKIAHTYGPPDVVLMPIAPEEPRGLMQPSHVGVEEALQAFDDLSATHFFPIHWGTFAFGTDRFQDPIEKLQSLWSGSERGSKKLHLIPAGRVVVLDKI